jgi:hypothetical protein
MRRQRERGGVKFKRKKIESSSTRYSRGEGESLDNCIGDIIIGN